MTKQNVLVLGSIFILIVVCVWWEHNSTLATSAEAVKSCIEFGARRGCDPALLVPSDLAKSRYGSELLQLAVEHQALDFASSLAAGGAKVSDATIAAAWDWSQPLRAPDVVAYSGDMRPLELLKTLLISRYGQAALGAATHVASNQDRQKKAHEVMKLLLDSESTPTL
jgi:hypothetical protein